MRPRIQRGEPIIGGQAGAAGHQGRPVRGGRRRQARDDGARQRRGRRGRLRAARQLRRRHGQHAGGRRKGAATQDKSISKIVLERILVLAVAQEADRDDTKPKVVNAVTLELSPEQAEKLDLARSVGTLSLVLRNQIDPNPAETAGATKSDPAGHRPQPAPRRAPRGQGGAAPRRSRSAAAATG